MSLSKTLAILIAALLAPCMADAQNQLANKPNPLANKISCPVNQVTYGAGQNLPDPWYSLNYVMTEMQGPLTSVNTQKEMLYCEYSGDPNQSRPLTEEGPLPDWLPNPGSVHPNKLFVIRPRNPDLLTSQFPCPSSIKVKTLTSVAAPWMGTYYVWPLKEKWTYIPFAQNVPGGFNVCEYHGGVTPRQVYRPLTVEEKRDIANLGANPPASIDDLKQVFAVSKVQLKAIPAKATTTCPATVRFEGVVAANGAGKVVYRTEINGAEGPPRELSFNSMGQKVVKFDAQIDPPAAQAGIANLATQAKASNVVHGQARIVIKSPPDGVQESNFAKYEIACSALGQAGNLAPTPNPPDPPPPGNLPVAAPTQQPAEQPARISGIAAPAAVALPDLQIRTVAVDPAKPNVVKVQIVNTGAAPSAMTRVRVWVAPQSGAWYGIVAALAPGQEVWATVQANLPVLTADHVYARVDDPHKVKESNEQNNGHQLK